MGRISPLLNEGPIMRELMMGRSIIKTTNEPTHYDITTNTHYAPASVYVKIKPSPNRLWLGRSKATRKYLNKKEEKGGEYDDDREGEYID
ncbi:hypothetical protein E2C01_036318 [Portunus trituberculatus]|uniref:Uncharacterized protein n=1 Tax=Portunus trituberculatus TaxID=210409 RepID=A0A5B7F6F7_PORTR|nr:hypothetical protein [Portunus trituberculatus]